MSETGKRVFENTADTDIVAYGRDLPELFSNATQAALAIIVEPSSVKTRNHIEVHINGDGLDDLMVRWLNELVYLFDTEQFMICEVSFIKLDSRGLDAVCGGETVCKQRHQLRTGIKAATYHQLEFRQTDAGWQTRVYLDL